MAQVFTVRLLPLFLKGLGNFHLNMYIDCCEATQLRGSSAWLLTGLALLTYTTLDENESLSKRNYGFNAEQRLRVILENCMNQISRSACYVTMMFWSCEQRDKKWLMFLFSCQISQYCHLTHFIHCHCFPYRKLIV